ncbi:MAG: leucine-rich repeat protein [Eggerthellaceae bacterium]|nr:leucine-rich repeat protein [Eggerthellaceae bacterium]
MNNSLIKKQGRACAAHIKLAAFAVAFAALIMAFGVSAQPADAYAADLVAGGLDANASAQVDAQSTYEHPGNDSKISIGDKTAGTVSYNASTKTITLDNVKAETLSIYYEGQSFTLVLNGSSSLTNLFSYSSITMKGTGSLAVSDTFCAFNKSVLTMTQGTIQGKVQAGSLVMRGGTIKGSGDSANIIAKYGLTMSSGTINLASPKYTGISISSGDFTMTGGSLSVTNAGSDAIDVSKYANSSSIVNIGKATISGGSLTLTVANPKYSSAVYAGSMSNKLGCIKTIAGRLPCGAKFTVGGNLYEVMKSTMYARLLKYNAKSKKAKINKATYGKYAYEVAGIGANAFNTAAGKKVTSITINSYLTEIGAKAFYNTKALKTLTLKSTGWMQRLYDKKYNLKKVKVAKDCSVARKAFSKAGKKGGKGLTVKLGKSGVWSKEAGKYKAFLKSKGLSSSAKLKTW